MKLKVDCYITIDWNGSRTNGKGECAILFYYVGGKYKGRKVIGYKNLTYPCACALSAYHAVEGLKFDAYEIDLTIITENAYALFMMNKRDFERKAYSYKSIWQGFQRFRQRCSSFSAVKDKRHKYIKPALEWSAKGGYKMHDFSKGKGNAE